MCSFVLPATEFEGGAHEGKVLLFAVSVASLLAALVCASGIIIDHGGGPGSQGIIVERGGGPTAQGIISVGPVPRA